MAAEEDGGRRKPELRKDAVNNRWVIFSPARSRRPSDFKSRSPAESDNSTSGGPKCAFCIGREHECAPEIFRLPHESAADWSIRVIQNLYPALSRDLETPFLQNPNPDPGPHSPHSALLGFGFHDVVIESPLHSTHLSDLSPHDVGQVLLAHKRRIDQIAQHGSIKYVQVFKNHGASAGASMSHSHSQLIGTPVVPPNVAARIDCLEEYFSQTGKCSVCELQTKHLLIDESTHFIAIVPFAAATPFEIWIIPRDHSSHFHHLDDQKAFDLGGLLKLMLRKMSMQLKNPPFNLMIHTSPFQITSSQLAYTHWYLQIVPQIGGVAGFEIGTGCYINPVFPEDAAKVLKEVEVPD